MKKLLQKIRHRFFPIHPTFDGWGMTTVTTHPPWNSPAGCDVPTSRFFKCNDHLKELVRSGRFIMTQFPGTTAIPSLDVLMWRNYIVYVTAQLAIRNTDCPQKDVVECGVCDGMGIYYAMTAAKDNDRRCEGYLYDSWGRMEEGRLLETEKYLAGDYSYLDIENTKKNLEEFSEYLHFNRGYIPDSFKTSDNPKSLVLLMIDLNSAVPTSDALDFFFDRIAHGGIILFDDYSWILYEDTKRVADEFLKDRPGTMLALPTGQSLFIKS